MKTIAILLATDKCIDTVEGFPDDSKRFIDMMRLAGDRFRFAVIPVHDSVFPDTVADYDGYIITGSSVSVNGDEPWLQRLFALVREIKANSIPLFGSCFGHQAIAKALGGEVSVNPFGWSVGTEVTEFVRSERWLPDNGRSLRLYSAHQEQVTRLPHGARVIGVNRRCPIAAFAVGDSVFTTQYHPEMTPEFIGALVEMMETDLGDSIQDARDQLRLGSEMKAFADCLAAFFDQTPDADGTGGDTETADRWRFAADISERASQMALDYFNDIPSLQVEHKGAQDPVSDADRAVETLIRDGIAAAFPDDGIIGEEFAVLRGSSGFDWVIDPIDGTANFIRGIPVWSVVIACMKNSRTVIGSVNDPVHDEHFICRGGRGAFLNGRPLRVSGDTDLSQGLMGIGTSARANGQPVPALTAQLLERGSLFARSGSGALGLAYVACGRYLGYMEDHMNAWDCLAGILLAEEAGAVTHGLDHAVMIEKGGIVVTAAPGVFHDVRAISQSVFGA